MEDLKIVVGKNLAALRKKKKLTQIELAEKFNYSDKAVSKWEQGATLPDLETLKQLCDFYGVSIDYLTKEENIKDPHVETQETNITFINHIITSCLLGMIIWMVATIIFVYPLVVKQQQTYYWNIFIWAVPATCLVVFFMNLIYFKANKTLTFIALTTFVWSLLAGVFIHFFFFAYNPLNLWPVFLVGIPMQGILLLWFVRLPTKKVAKRK